MPNCSSCGQPLSGAGRYCSSCGAAQAPPRPPRFAPAGPPQPPAAPVRTPFPGWAVALIVLAGVAVLGAVATFVVSFILPFVMIGSLASVFDALPTPTPTPVEAREAAVREGVHAIQLGIQSWYADHGDRFLPRSVVTPDGLRDYVDVWPANPYTGGPMLPAAAPGAPGQPGDYLYTRLDNGARYLLSTFGVGDRPGVTVP